MPTPTRQSRRSAAKPLLGALRPAALAATLLVLAPAALANDRDLRGTPIPAAACIVNSGSSFEQPGVEGWFSETSGILRLRCPLPVNNIELSSTSNDNDISKFRVHYRDGDGFGGNVVLLIQLIKTIVINVLTAQSTPVCSWNSNVDGTGSTGVVTSTKACAHDLAAGAFYHFNVFLAGTPGGPGQFLGIDFPS